MKKHVGMISLAGILVIVLLISTVAFTVDESRDIVIIKTFGQITKTYRGKSDAGLHFKWPWPIQEQVRYDSRTFIFEDTTDEVKTYDNQNVLVTMFGIWRIKDAERFNRAVGTADGGEKQVRTLLRTAKSNVFNRHSVSNLVNTNPGELKLEVIEDAILEQVAPEALAEYGIEVVMVGIKSLQLPESATRDVIAGMKAEREKFIQDVESRGEADAKAITEKAKSAREQILAFTKIEAAKIRSEGNLAVAAQYVKFRENPGLSMFLRWLDSLEIILKDRSEFVIDPSFLPGLEFFRSGPSTEVGIPTGPEKKDRPKQ